MPADLWAASEYAKLMSFVGSHDVAVAAMKTHFRAAKSDVARILLAYFYFKNGENGRSLDELDDLKDPTLAKDFNMGIVYFKMKKWEKGIQRFDKVPNESPLVQKARFNAAYGLENQGKIPAALERLAGIDGSSEVKGKATSYIQYLNEAKRRNPASDAAQSKENFESYLDWELPTL